MPRTVWQPDPRWKDDPRWNNPSHLRACAEEAHYEPQRKAFHIPLYIRPDPQVQTAYQVPHISPKDCRDFCWKDCVIYGNAGLTTSDHYALLEEVYREWYPHRAEDKDVSDGNFFAKFMRLIPPATNLMQIVRFHEALCDKLSSLVPEIEDLEPAIPYAVPPKEETRRVGAYKLRETIFDVCIVINAGWQEQGVLLVWKNDDVAKKYNCSEVGEVQAYDIDAADGLGDACVFRCPLKRAMQMVVSQDPVRAQKRAEYNEMLEETLGEAEDGYGHSG